MEVDGGSTCTNVHRLVRRCCVGSESSQCQAVKLIGAHSTRAACMLVVLRDSTATELSLGTDASQSAHEAPGIEILL